ncbi:serine protease Do [Acinetobacter puyangensis]|uniref:Serine protease Do n=2 Tax=Acinetobacter puyangensis TaxID=1096779 RepID=A0A240E448_9GAMM|nr:serine protease Do [Acinetobacter puyangensis]
MLKKLLFNNGLSFMKKLNHALGIMTFAVTTMTAQAAIPVDFSNLVEQVSPAVVSVSATKSLSQQEMMQEQVPELLRRFFGNQIIIPQQQIPREQNAYGSAFFISSDGYLLTNHHVIKDASKVTITLNDRRELDADVVGSDERTDVALLKVKGDRFPALKTGDVDQLKVGQPVLAIGSPFGFDYSASAGIVSAKSRTMFNETSVPFIQTDVALNPGNSGGPLFNEKGEVVGVNSRIFSGTGGYMGLSFSIPIDVAMDVVNQLRTTGKVSRPYLGVMLQDVDRNLAEAYRLDKPEGALITQVAPNSPAQKAGLKAGDIILSYNGRNLVRTSDLINLINRTQINQKINLTILRNQRRQELAVTLVSSPDETPPAKKESADNPSSKLGIALRELNAQEKARYKLQGVVVQNLSYAGLAARSGIQQYDVITQIADKQIKSLADFKQAIESIDKKAVVPVYIVRQGQPTILGLRLDN